jgi:hypothetical protein
LTSLVSVTHSVPATPALAKGSAGPSSTRAWILRVTPLANPAPVATPTTVMQRSFTVAV